MKTYDLQQDFSGLPKGTKLFGPFALTSSHLPAYFLQKDIPQEGEAGSNGFFASAVEHNPEIFKEVVNSQP